MKMLLVFDEKNYTEDMPVFEKYAARAIIMKSGKIAATVNRESIKEGDKTLEDIFFEITESNQENMQQSEVDNMKEKQ